MFFLAPDEKTFNEINKTILFHLNNTEPVLKKIVPVIRLGDKQNFINQESPQGKKWQKSKAAKKRASKGLSPLTLVDSGEMSENLLYPIINSSIKTFASDLADEYAHKHQFGGLERLASGDEILLPQRQFAGLSNANISIVENIILENMFS